MKRASLLTCFALLGCQAPARVIEGIFVVNGEPKSGVEVRLPSNLDDFTDCNGAPVSAVTDQSGRFRASITKFPVRPCFTVDGKIYSDSFIADDRTQKPIALRCTLPLSITGHFEDGHVCN